MRPSTHARFVLPLGRWGRSGTSHGEATGCRSPIARTRELAASLTLRLMADDVAVEPTEDAAFMVHIVPGPAAGTPPGALDAR
jgi:hypothetical protein